ncbi:MAG: hypothetical protein U0800_12175 [Isosphaeraceae bacterium]
MNARAFSIGLVAIAAVGCFPAFAQQPQPTRVRPIRDALDVLIFRPPPSAVSGVETPASRMARYYELGGGVGPMPGESNGPSAGYILPGASDIPGWSVPLVPGAGRDPAMSATNRQRVMNRYQAWRARAYPADR